MPCSATDEESHKTPLTIDTVNSLRDQQKIFRSVEVTQRVWPVKQLEFRTDPAERTNCSGYASRLLAAAVNLDRSAALLRPTGGGRLLP